MVRFKNRYLVCEITSSHTSKTALEKMDIFHCLSNTIEKIHGEFGLAAVRSGLAVKYFNPDTKICIVRARHGPHNLLASALPFVTSYQQNKMQLRTLHLGATLACCYKFMQKYQRSQLMLHWNELAPSQRQRLEKLLEDNEITKFLEEAS